MTATHKQSDEAPAAESPKPQPEPTESASEIRERLDQVGAILGKGLDLAEAGVSLGVTIVSRLGTVAQKQVLDRMMSAAFQAGVPPMGAAAEPAQPQPSSGMAEPSPAPATAPTFYITNRLPLSPGGAVKVSFSINNDSLVAPKKVALRVEGFAGEVSGASLPAAAVSVKPPSRTIAPVDFEKFVLRGTVPADAPPDVYVGWIVVDAEEQLRIPLRLTVSM
jgi:hypothetical protein